MTTEGKKLVIIGTSGSMDFLRGDTGRRFWPVTVPSGVSEDAQGCDGLHDETAPTQYLCTRCFPALGGDLLEPPDDDDDDDRRDDDVQME